MQKQFRQTKQFKKIHIRPKLLRHTFKLTITLKLSRYSSLAVYLTELSEVNANYAFVSDEEYTSRPAWHHCYTIPIAIDRDSEES